MSAQVFSDLEAMSRHQRARELDEALRVRAMDAADFSAWLERSLPPLQALASSIFSADGESFRPTARCFKTPAEKQAYDQQQELDRAVRLALKRSATELKPREKST